MILTFVKRVTAVSLAALLLSSCAEGDQGSGAGTTVVATTTQVADIAENVAGSRAEIVGLLAANSDPHDYEPQPSDAASLNDATLVVRSGGEVDDWAEELIESSGTDARVLELLDSVEASADDPHWWHDPENAVTAVEQIRDALSQADPGSASEFERNAAAYIREVEALDRAIATCMEAIPADQRKLVTNHDALGYFAGRYEIVIVGSTIPALTTQAQPSLGETTELVDLIQAEDVKTIFPEAGLDADLEGTIAEEAGASVGGELYADSLGEEGTPGATYLGALKANALTMAGGFTGDSSACGGIP